MTDDPHMMQCIEIRDRHLAVAERSVPVPKSGEVLVRVRAAGINRPDLLQIKGFYPPPAGVTDIPGLEIAGEVVGSGDLISPIRKGTRVCALVAGGGYAQYCTVPAGQCLTIPRKMDYITAAGLPETFFTVWTNFFDSAHLKKGDTVLVHGGASGIGTAAIQIARACGIHIIVTAGSEEKCAACKKLGAMHAINYKEQDFVAETMNATKGYGVDAVLDMIGGDYVPRNIKVLKIGGRHVSIAAQHGTTAEVDILHVMQGQLVLTGSTLRSRSVEEKTAIAKAMHKKIWPLLGKRTWLTKLLGRHTVWPVIDKTFNLVDAQMACEYLESGVNIGKVILEVKHFSSQQTGRIMPTIR